MRCLLHLSLVSMWEKAAATPESDRKRHRERGGVRGGDAAWRNRPDPPLSSHHSYTLSAGSVIPSLLRWSDLESLCLLVSSLEVSSKPPGRLLRGETRRRADWAAPRREQLHRLMLMPSSPVGFAFLALNARFPAAWIIILVALGWKMKL